MELSLLQQRTARLQDRFKVKWASSGPQKPCCRLLPPRAALRQPPEQRPAQKEPSKRSKKPEGDIAGPGWPRITLGALAGFCAWATGAGTALAGMDDQSVVGPTTDVLLGTGHEFSFTSLLLFMLITYWLLKALFYLTRNSPDGPESPNGPLPGPRDQQQQQQQGGLGDAGHAHIRSYVDSSQPPPGSAADAQELRNASLARSAAFRVAAVVRESLPRIHALVDQLAGPGHSWPPPAPRHAGVDFVADLVHSRVVQELAAKGPGADLGPRERAALETSLLEEVAAQVAREQVADFERMAAEGKLRPHPPGSGSGGGGAGHSPPPTSHAH